MELRVGARLRSQVCATEVIVVRPAAVELTCGGHAMIPIADTPAEGLAVDPALADGTQLGKRYTDEDGDLELLVTKSGEGTIAAGGCPLVIKESKALPSSD